MKLGKTFFQGFVLCFAITLMAYAHPPSDISANIKGRHLFVDIQHSVSNDKAHYIVKVEVFVNGKKVITQLFSSQEGNLQKPEYYIPGLKKGDTVRVVAYCNLGGKKSTEIRVSE